jgi:hypothetical protein
MREVIQQHRQIQKEGPKIQCKQPQEEQEDTLDNRENPRRGRENGATIKEASLAEWSMFIQK